MSIDVLTLDVKILKMSIDVLILDVVDVLRCQQKYLYYI